MHPPLSSQATPPFAVRFFEDFDTLAAPLESRSALKGAAGATREDPVQAAAIVAARAEGFAAGEREAARRAVDERRAATDRALTLVAEAVRAETETARAQAEAAAHDLARLLLASLRALFPALCDRHGAAEVAAIAGAVLPVVQAEPNLFVRSAPDAAAALRAELDRLPAEQAGRVTCLVEEAMRPGDLRIEWRGGVAERDTRAIMGALDAALEVAGLADVSPRTDA